MNLRWFSSRSVRVACDMSKHVRKILGAQRDILSTPAIIAVQTSLIEIKKAIADGANEEGLKKQMDNLEKTANKWLKPYPNATIRENVEVLLVALAVAMGIHVFSSTVQNPHRLHAADTFWRDFKSSAGSRSPAGFEDSQPTCTFLRFLDQ